MEKLIILLKLKIGEKYITQSVVSYTKDTKRGNFLDFGAQKTMSGNAESWPESTSVWYQRR